MASGGSEASEAIGQVARELADMQLDHPGSEDAYDLEHCTPEKLMELQRMLMNLVEKGSPPPPDPSCGQLVPDHLLIKGIIEAGKENYLGAIDIFIQALELCSPSGDTTHEADRATACPAMSLREVKLNCLNQVGICYCQLGDYDSSHKYFQMAMNGYMGDPELIQHVMNRYSQLAMCTQSMGYEETETIPDYGEIEEDEDPEKHPATSPPAEQAPVPTEAPVPTAAPVSTEPAVHTEASVPTEGDISSKPSPQDAGAQSLAAEDGPSPVGDAKTIWFPQQPEELLDYSATYLQMMIMGAEMVIEQQQMMSRHQAQQKDVKSEGPAPPEVD